LRYEPSRGGHGELDGRRGFPARDGNARLRDEIRALDAKLGGEIEQAKLDLIKWSFVFWVTAVASIAGLAKVLR